MTVDPEVSRILKEFHSSGKPQALCCIAPILAANVLGKVILFKTKRIKLKIFILTKTTIFISNLAITFKIQK